jgi:hypothetical protein
MKILEVIGPPYPHAHELPVKRERPVNKSVSNKGGGNGKNPASRRNDHLPRYTGRALTEAQAAERRITEAHRTVMVLEHGKLRKVRQ